MAWSTSNRRLELPSNWHSLRKRILTRDNYQCTHTSDGVRCGNRATDVDHVKPGNDHRDTNLTSLCSDHHRVKSSREGKAAAMKKRREINARYRRTEKHPGLL